MNRGWFLALALVIGGCCGEREEGTDSGVEPCGISCEGTYPVACVVARTDGPFWTCAADAETCEGIPGEVCE